MMKTLLLCALVYLASAQQEEDDGQYYPEKYEAPYANENSVSQQQQQQPVYQPQSYQAPQPVSYQPAPAPARYQAPQQYTTDSRQAAILSENRYLSGDGKFGASYTQEDGVEFKEEALPDGSRRGQYSYVDPSGQRRTVTYTAGKHGFQASGDHLPQAPAPVAPVAPQPQYQPQPKYNPQPQYQPQYDPEPQYQPRPQARYQAQPAAPVANGPSHPSLSSQGIGGYSLSSAF